MIILKKYRLITKNDLYYAKSADRPVCPLCGGALKVRDSKRRQVILPTGETRTFLLRRLKCTACGTLHQEMPDLFVPNKHYSREVIDKALSGGRSCCPAENSTIYRWSREKGEAGQNEGERAGLPPRD